MFSISLSYGFILLKLQFKIDLLILNLKLHSHQLGIRNKKRNKILFVSICECQDGNIIAAAPPAVQPRCNGSVLPNEKLYEDCSNGNWIKFPVISNEWGRANVEIFNISSNPIHHVTRHDFEPYIVLQELIMHDIKGRVDSDFLIPLEHLRILDISRCEINSRGEEHPNLGEKIPDELIKFPHTLKRLIANQLRIPAYGFTKYSLELSNLNLFELSATLNRIENFPNLNETFCRIVFLDLSGNPLTNFTYKNLAPFCTLKTFVLNNSSFSSNEACCGVQKWIQEHGISSNLTCSASSCNVDFEDAAKEKYEQCLIKIGYYKTNPLFTYFLIFVIVLLLGVICLLLYRFIISRSADTSKSSEIPAQSSAAQKASEDEDDEEEESE